MPRVIYTFDALGNETSRMSTPAEDANVPTLISRATAAITTNIAALALPDPSGANSAYVASPVLVAGASAAQVQAYVRLMDAQLRALTNQNNSLMSQVRALTKQNTALERYLLGRADTVDGT